MKKAAATVLAIIVLFASISVYADNRYQGSNDIPAEYGDCYYHNRSISTGENTGVFFFELPKTQYSRFNIVRTDITDLRAEYISLITSDKEFSARISIIRRKDGEEVYSETLLFEHDKQKLWDLPDELMTAGEKYYLKAEPVSGDDMQHGRMTLIGNAGNSDYIINVSQTGAQVKACIGDKLIESGEMKPYIDKNGRTMIPARALADACGCDIEWIDLSKEVVIRNKYLTLTGCAGSDKLKVMYEYAPTVMTVNMDTEICIVNNTAYLPLYFAAPCLNYDVVWTK